MRQDIVLDGRHSTPALGDILRTQARAVPDKAAITFNGRSATYGELAASAFRIANALRDAGLGRGDRIAILAKNSAAFFELFLGAATLGVVLAPLNWRLAASEIAFLLEDSQASLLFVGDEFMSLAAQAIRDGDGRPRLIALDDLREGGFQAWRDAASDEDPAIEIDPSEVALQLYTSGTTGRPKGALLSHRALNCVRVTQPAEVNWSQWTPEDVCLVSMPLFHVGGIGLALASLYYGARMVIVREFSADAFFEMLDAERITRLFLVPAALQIVLQHPRAASADYSRIRYIVYGASPIGQALLRDAIAVIGCGFVQAYGMTETSGTVVALGPEDHSLEDDRRMGAAGRPLVGVEVIVLGEAGERLPPGRGGEIAIRSGANMLGYWRRPEETAASFTADGFLRTGDAGHVDDDGYVWILDRVKDMIITGGENVYAAEVETVLADHPDVAEVAVIGVPDAKWGEAVKAVIVPTAGATVEAGALLAWARTRLAAFKVPKSIDLIEALPRNASGKVLRRVLRAPYWEGRDRAI
jgi:long-chain acyl-CoA synthetase